MLRILYFVYRIYTHCIYSIALKYIRTKNIRVDTRIIGNGRNGRFSQRQPQIVKKYDILGEL